jgi:putative flippase GtrA
MRRIDGAFVRFLLVGMCNSALGLSVIYVAWHGLGFSDVAANAAGYGVGFGCGYCLNKRWTFGAAPPRGQGVWRYAAVCACAYGLNLLAMQASRGQVSADSLLPHAIGLATYTVVAYLGSRWFVFV